MLQLSIPGIFHQSNFIYGVEYKCKYVYWFILSMYFCIPVGRQVRTWTVFKIYTMRLFYWLASSMHLASTFSGLAWTFNIPIHERKVTYRSIARVESSMCWYINPCFQDGTHDLYDVNTSPLLLYCAISHGLSYGHVDDTKASEKAAYRLLLNPPLWVYTDSTQVQQLLITSAWCCLYFHLFPLLIYVYVYMYFSSA